MPRQSLARKPYKDCHVLRQKLARLPKIKTLAAAAQQASPPLLPAPRQFGRRPSLTLIQGGKSIQRPRVRGNSPWPGKSGLGPGSHKPLGSPVPQGGEERSPCHAQKSSGPRSAEPHEQNAKCLLEWRRGAAIFLEHLPNPDRAAPRDVPEDRLRDISGMFSPPPKNYK